MSYAYRSKGTGERPAELVRDKLNRGLLAYRKRVNSVTAELSALQSQTELEIAQAIWNGMAHRTVASAAGMSVSDVRSLALAFEDLSQTNSGPASHLRALRELNEQAGRLKAQQEQLGQQREQLIVTALETGLLEPPWVAAVSGVCLERVKVLAQQTRHSISN